MEGGNAGSDEMEGRGGEMPPVTRALPLHRERAGRSLFSVGVKR